MRFVFAAALALTVASSLAAQTAGDLSTTPPISGQWTYVSATDGSESTFADSTGNPQLWVHCVRATRHVTIAKRASAAAPLLNIWTSSMTRDVASSYNPATGRLTIDLAAYDPLLDAIVSSRGRVGFRVGVQAPLIVPAWAEAARVIEDCRV